MRLLSRSLHPVANPRIVAAGAERRAETRRPHIEWIPIQPTPMVDRPHEVETIQRLLTGDGVRLLTLLGPAGVGKTRLALAAASRLVDHVRNGVVVDLSTIRDHQSALPTIASMRWLPWMAAVDGCRGQGASRSTGFANSARAPLV